MCFGIVWIICFLLSCNEFVIICSATTWYFSRKDIPDDDGIPGDSDVSKGLWWTFRYHMGSLAFGSIILAIVWIIKVIFEYLGNKMAGSQGNNGCTRCLLGCIFCCLDCFDRFIRYLTMNAYIYMAISSENFCESALNSFILLLKNAAEFSFVSALGMAFMFLCKFCIAILTTLIAFFLLPVMLEEGTTVNFFWPVFLIFCFSFVIAHVFVSVFDIGANTILQCYLIDVDIAKQHNLDPKHIPPTLTAFLHIHNEGKPKKTGYDSDEERKIEMKRNLLN